MTGQQLKNSILQMAVQGKLVPQDPNDEPASALLERIRKEKEQLIKEGKIKKEKNPSYIFRGPDNLPYEKVGNNEPVCIADEAPFEIPDSWEWVRLGSAIELQSGQDMTPDKYNDNGNGIPYITGASNIIDGSVIINRWTACGKTFAHRGDILLTCKGTVGTMAILQEEIVHIARQVMAIRPIGNLYAPYIQLVLETMVEDLKAAAKSMIPGISRNDVLASLFPVPPLNEQHRIIAKLKEVDPYIHQYEKSESILRHMDNIFPETLKKSILQWAVQGKLVSQNPNDEPASVLLERIREEKQRLVKEGKIKKDKHESIIFRRNNSYYEKLDGIERCIDDELPFEIPDSWEWVRLKELCFIINGFTPLRTNVEYWENPTIHWFTVDDIRRQGRRIKSTIQSINEKALAKNTNRILPPGTVLLCCTASVGEFAITEIPLTTNQQFNGLVIKDYWKNYFWNEFLFTIAETFKDRLLLLAGKTTINFISVKKLENLVIPLPPINEQHRIVKKLNEISPHIKQEGAC